MQKKTTVKDIDKLLNEDIINKLKKAENQINNGEIVDAEKVFSEMRKKYEY